MNIALIHFKEPSAVKNSIEYRRLLFLSQHYHVFYITSKRALIPDEIRRQVRLYRVPLEVNGNKGDWSFLINYSLYAAFCSWVIPGLLLRRHIDLVYTFHYPDCLIALAAKMLGARWAVDVLDLPDIYLDNASQLQRLRKSYLPWARRALVGLLRAALRHADLVIAPGTSNREGIAKELRRSYKVGEERILALPNSIDLELTRPSSTSFPSDGFRVAYVGFVTPRRGIETLLEAVALALPEIPEIHMDLAGWAKEEDSQWLRDCLIRLGLEDRVTYYGVVPHHRALEIMEQASVCVYPFPETVFLDGVMPVKVLEYLALNKAVVATSLEGVRNVIVDGYNGLLVEPQNAKAMSEALMRLHRDAELRKKLEGNARASIQQYHWAEVYHSLASRLTALCQQGKV